MAADGIGVVAALDWEAGVFSVDRTADPGFLVETTGPGPASAAAGAERALAGGASLLVSWGSAGALGRAAPGDIVLAYRVCDGSQRHFETDPVLTERLALAFDGIAPVHRAILASVDAPVATPSAKRALADSTGARAVDMETAAIARIAAAFGVPLVVVRVIVDRADRSVPAVAIAAMDGPRIRPGRVLTGLLRSPADTGGLIALGFAARRARRTLAACALKLSAALRTESN